MVTNLTLNIRGKAKTFMCHQDYVMCHRDLLCATRFFYVPPRLFYRVLILLTILSMLDHPNDYRQSSKV